MDTLTSEQEAFLRECDLEFSERYTIGDPDFKKIHESDIPTPPIAFPWYTRSRFNNRERFGSNNHKPDEDFNRKHDYRDNYNRYNENRGRERYPQHNRDQRHSDGSSSNTGYNRRFRPY